MVNACAARGHAVISIWAMLATSRADCVALDTADPLAALRDAFVLPEGVTYLDGNSLGALPRQSAARVQQVVEAEWGQGLIGSWNSAGWIDLAQRVGDKIGALIGARPGEVMVGDSTSINLFKTLHAAVALAQSDDPKRRVIVSERSNFPTDLYIAESVAAQTGCTLRFVDAEAGVHADAGPNADTGANAGANAGAGAMVDADVEAEVGASIGDGSRALHAVEAALGSDVAVLMLTHVHYRSGRMWPMARTTRAAHAAGALVVWDLAHSAGAVPLALNADEADFAVGCGYKYLNGGPGAPAFLWAHARHTERMDREHRRQPLSGWLGHAAPFAFTSGYTPAAGVQRFVCGTPPVISLAALDSGLDVFVAADAHGGIGALRAKSIALADLFIERVDAFAATHGLTLVTPRDASLRGSQVSYAHADAHAVMQALIARGVIGDFRAGDATVAVPQDLLRFGFTPLYTRFIDVWDAAAALADVLDTEAWRDPRFAQRAAVT